MFKHYKGALNEDSVKARGKRSAITSATLNKIERLFYKQSYLETVVMVTSNEKEGGDEHTCEHKSSTAREQNGDHFAWHQDDQKE